MLLSSASNDMMKQKVHDWGCPSKAWRELHEFHLGRTGNEQMILMANFLKFYQEEGQSPDVAEQELHTSSTST